MYVQVDGLPKGRGSLLPNSLAQVLGPPSAARCTALGRGVRRWLSRVVALLRPALARKVANAQAKLMARFYAQVCVQVEPKHTHVASCWAHIAPKFGDLYLGWT